jgi:hypothetical protein
MRGPDYRTLRDTDGVGHIGARPRLGFGTRILARALKSGLAGADIFRAQFPVKR